MLKPRSFSKIEYSFLESLIDQLKKKLQEDGGEPSEPSASPYNSQTALWQRAENLLLWYTRKANHSKHTYYACSMSIIGIPLVIAALNTLSTAEPSVPVILPFLITLLSGITSLLSGWLVLSRCQENWINYRTAVEDLKEEIVLYLSGDEPYEACDIGHGSNPGKSLLLGRRMESIVRRERSQWSKIRSKKEDEERGQG